MYFLYYFTNSILLFIKELIERVHLEGLAIMISGLNLQEPPSISGTICSHFDDTRFQHSVNTVDIYRIDIAVHSSVNYP